jgi:galactokinase
MTETSEHPDLCGAQVGDPTDRVIRAFRDRYGTSPEIAAAAPGRVNLIGEHTDYTGGFVLPAAIDREIVIAASFTHSPTVRGFSLDFESEADCPVGQYDPRHPAVWFRYVMGVLAELEIEGISVSGFRFVIGGNIPIGAGLSSSAALEIAALTTVEGFLGFRMEDTRGALLCQRAENRFVGVNCGIMDQLISRAGRRGCAVFIDCSDLGMRAVTADIPGTCWVVVDSKKRRGLVDSEYNRRRRECEEALACARARFHERRIAGLRDVAVPDIPLLEGACPDAVFRRLRHIVSENDRVLRTVEALEAGDAAAVGALLSGSHTSLRDDFEVSCGELDRLVDILSDVPGIHGARLTGAGFGGCVIALASRDALPALNEAVMRAYRPPPPTEHADIWLIEPSEGARIIEKNPSRMGAKLKRKTI